MRASSVLAAVVVLVLASGAGATAAGYGPFADAAGDLPDPVGQIADGAPDASGGATGGTGDGGSDAGSAGDGGGGSGGDGDGAADSSSGDAGATPTSPFTTGVVSIEECGRTCRDVTLRVTNEQNETATGVTAEAVIFAGKSTDASDEVWSDGADLGTLEAGESVQVTRRVELGLMDAAAIKDADGWVTVRTTVQSDDARATFTEEKQVA